MKSLFLINVRSGARRFDVESVIRQHFASPFDIAPCTTKEELDDILDAAAASGFEVVYAVGGDGTVHEIAKRLAGRNLALGILPIGSGNGFARHLGVPLHLQTCLRAGNDSDIVAIDTAETGSNRFAGVMGLGFDALIADRFASASSRGLKTYIRAGLSAFSTFQAEDYEIEVDGKRIDRRAFVVVVANSGHYGNNARIAPEASVTDGLLDLVIVDDLSLLHAPRLLLRLFRGNIHRSSHVTIVRGREIVIRRESPGLAHMDGEPLHLSESIVVRVDPRSLRVLVPRTGAKI